MRYISRADLDKTSSRQLKARDHHQEGRFTRIRRPQEREKFSRLHIDGDTTDCGNRPVPFSRFHGPRRFHPALRSQWATASTRRPEKSGVTTSTSEEASVATIATTGRAGCLRQWRTVTARAAQLDVKTTHDFIRVHEHVQSKRAEREIWRDDENFARVGMSDVDLTCCFPSFVHPCGQPRSDIASSPCRLVSKSSQLRRGGAGKASLFYSKA